MIKVLLCTYPAFTKAIPVENRKFLNNVNSIKLGSKNVMPPSIMKQSTVVISTPQANIGITTGLHLFDGKGESTIINNEKEI